MSSYFLISSRDPFECRETVQLYRLAINLKNDGHAVTVFLVQNGVLPARKSARCREFSSLLKQGIHIEVDDFSARERGMQEPDLRKGTHLAPIDHVVDGMVKGMKTLWH